MQGGRGVGRPRREAAGDLEEDASDVVDVGREAGLVGVHCKCARASRRGTIEHRGAKSVSMMTSEDVRTAENDPLLYVFPLWS